MDYQKLGLRVGIEIHQQLAGRKLFCNCPAEISDATPELVVERRLRASASELGKIDAAALHEQAKKKFFVYKGYEDHNCLVELDEEPPHGVNKDCLDQALQVAQLLQCSLVDEVQVMRKVVIDGSNVSGFQRTMLVGVDGHVTLSNGKKIVIESVCLEEEAAKKVDDNDERREYNISRLGIALLEIATGPDMNTPEEAQEAAALLGMVLRSVKGMRRGIGTIRQDVNVSIRGSKRVEVKGFQDLRSIPKVIAYEVERQKRRIGKEDSHVRKAEPDNTTSFLRPMPGAARMYPETDVPPIRITKELLASVALPELLSEKILRLEKDYGLQAEYARELVKVDLDIAPYLAQFKELDANYIAQVLLAVPKDLKTRFKVDPSVLTSEHFIAVLGAVAKKLISREAVPNVLVDVCEGKEIDFAKYKVVSEDEVEEAVKKIVLANKGAPFGAIMGEVMKKYRGKVDGNVVSALVRKYL